MIDSSTSGTARPSKILFVSHEATRTGAPMFLLHFLRWLRRETDQEFELLLNHGGPLEPEFAKVARVHLITAAGLPSEFFAQFGLLYSNTCCNGLFLELQPYGDIPIVTHVHELDYGIDSLGARNFAGVMRQSSRFVACARIVADRLRHRFRLPADQVSVHYEMISASGVASNVQAESPAALREKYDIPADAYVLAGCGTVDLRKAPDLFVQLAARLHRQLGGRRPLRCCWIGKTNDRDLERILRHDIRRLGLEREITFIGELAAPHGLLGLSDLFCLTSREDPFPLVMLEAAALRKPVVCFDQAGGGSEFCAFGGGYAVPFLDVAAMADKCHELLIDSVKREEVGARAAEAVRTRFTVEAVAPELWREIQGLLRHPPALPVYRADDGNARIFESWRLEEAPERPYVLAHLARQAVRREARVAAEGGRRSEAVQALVRAARLDLESKAPAVMVESLVEISGDLAPLDQIKARYLRSEAERIAKLAGIPLRPLGGAKESGQNPQGALNHHFLAK
jgi:glycosyltransferase involved in cell wall biosynthesis